MDQRVSLWADTVSTYSGGRIQLSLTDINPNEEYALLSDGPGTNPAPIEENAGYLDYADPEDPVCGCYCPDYGYNHDNAVAERMRLDNGTSCSPNLLTHIHASRPPTQACRGAAYRAMSALRLEASDAPSSERPLLYNLGERIAKRLPL
jgi:hypothetical protein